MGREKLMEKNGCQFINHPDEAIMAKLIRDNIENEAMMKDGVHEKCPWNCPWKIREFIEKEEDPNFLLQDLVKVGEPKVKTENFIKAINKAVQDLDDPNEPIKLKP
jgi:hypothetical protein